MAAVMLPHRKWLRISESVLYLAGVLVAAFWSMSMAVWAASPSWLGLVVLVWAPVGSGYLISNALAPAKWKLIALVFVGCFGAGAMFVTWHPRQVFVRTLDSVKGQDQAQVVRTMRSYIRATSTPLQGDVYVPEDLRSSHPTLLLQYRWNDVDGEFNSDVGQVFLRDGHVVGTEFLPD